MRLLIALFLCFIASSCEQPHYFEDSLAGKDGLDRAVNKGIPLVDKHYEILAGGGGDIFVEGERTYIVLLAGFQKPMEWSPSNYKLLLYTIDQEGKKEEVIRSSSTPFFKKRGNNLDPDSNYIRIYRNLGVLSIIYLNSDDDLVLLEKNGYYWNQRTVISGVSSFDIDKARASKLAYSDGWDYYYCSDFKSASCEQINLNLDAFILFPSIRLFHNTYGEPGIVTIFWRDRDSRDARPIYIYKDNVEWKGRYYDTKVDRSQVVGATVFNGELKMCFISKDNARVWRFDFSTHQLLSSYSVNLLSGVSKESCSPLWQSDDSFITYDSSMITSKVYRYVASLFSYKEVLGDSYYILFYSGYGGNYALYSDLDKVYLKKL